MSIIIYLSCVLFIGWLISRFVRSKSRPPHYRSFHSKVVGVSFSNLDGTKRQNLIKTDCKPGHALELRPEPDNPHDPHAIGVWLPTGQIGYIEAGRLAMDLSSRINASLKTTVTVAHITGGTEEHPNRGVNILIHLWTPDSEAP